MLLNLVKNYMRFF